MRTKAFGFVNLSQLRVAGDVIFVAKSRTISGVQASLTTPQFDKLTFRL